MGAASAEDRFDGLPARTLPGGMRVVRAATRGARARGLARLDSMPRDLALEIPSCRSIHTFGMRFPIDLVWLDGDGRPLRLDPSVPPRRLRTCMRAHSVVECGAGTAPELLAGLAEVERP